MSSSATNARKRRPKRTRTRRGRTELSAQKLAEAVAATNAPPPFIVDVHCHTFNASDLSKVGFITDVLLDSDESVLGPVVHALVTSLSKLMLGAPGFQAEVDHLGGDGSINSFRFPAARALASADARDAVDRAHRRNVANELRRLSISSNGQERALFDAIVQEVYPGGIQALALAPQIESPADLAQRVLLSRGTISRYFKWVGRLKHFRSEIIGEIIQTYGGRGDVQLFASALVDFEFWLEREKPDTAIDQQIDLGTRLARAFPGRIHFFAPYDPWREIGHDAAAPGSFELVQKAVLEGGFLGVKLYPPMGFAPADNDTLDFSPVGVTDSPAFGAHLQTALDRLFAWAVEEDVPIMAHCNLSEESKHHFALRASPVFWADALSKHPGLRVNLGHFGGQDNLGPGGVNAAADWPEIIMGLMGEGNRLYTDIGNFDMSDTKWFGALSAALENNSALRSHLMYGSDWMMLAKSDRSEQFLDLFRKGLSSISGLSQKEIADILGGNARDFLGLNPGEKPRLRLEAFYSRNKIPLPAWLS